MNRKEWHEETVARLKRAAARLEERAGEAGHGERQRLEAKADGVKLALSYLREIPREVEEEELDNAERLQKARDRVRDAYYFADELEHADMAEILGGVELVDQ